jgi:hypothetical protein
VEVFFILLGERGVVAKEGLWMGIPSTLKVALLDLQRYFPRYISLKSHLSEIRQQYSSNLIPVPYQAPRITLKKPVLDYIIVTTPTNGRERESNREDCNKTLAYLPGADI